MIIMTIVIYHHHNYVRVSPLLLTQTLIVKISHWEKLKREGDVRAECDRITENTPGFNDDRIILRFLVVTITALNGYKQKTGGVYDSM